MAVVHTVVNLSPAVALYVLALIAGMIGSAVRIRDGSTGMYVAWIGVALFCAIMGEILAAVLL